MKRLFVVALVVALLAAAWIVGRAAGVRHAITDGVLYIVDYDAPEGGEYDLTVYIDIDGQTYAHGLYIG